LDFTLPNVLCGHVSALQCVNQSPREGHALDHSFRVDPGQNVEGVTVPAVGKLSARMRAACSLTLWCNRCPPSIARLLPCAYSVTVYYQTHLYHSQEQYLAHDSLEQQPLFQGNCI